MTLEELRKSILDLPSDERQQLANWLLHLGSQSGSSRETASEVGITKTPGVCGGAACIVRTRIPVWVLEQLRRLDVGEPRILSSYPTLQASDLTNAWEYVENHRDEIEEEIRQNEEA